MDGIPAWFLAMTNRIILQFYTEGKDVIPKSEEGYGEKNKKRSKRKRYNRDGLYCPYDLAYHYDHYHHCILFF